MERDFYRFLLTLSATDRNDALVTFLHLLDDGELSHLIGLSQDELANRQKRSATRPLSGKRADQNCSGRQEPFKRLRIGPIVSTTGTGDLADETQQADQPNRRAGALLPDPVRSSAYVPMCQSGLGQTICRQPVRIGPFTSTPAKPVVVMSKRQDLLSSLVDGQPEPESEAADEVAGMLAQPAADLPPDEEDEFQEFLMNSEDDAIVSMVEDYNIADETLQAERQEGADSANRSAGGLLSAADKPTDAVGEFLTGRGKKKDVKVSDKVKHLLGE